MYHPIINNLPSDLFLLSKEDHTLLYGQWRRYYSGGM